MGPRFFCVSIFLASLIPFFFQNDATCLHQIIFSTSTLWVEGADRAKGSSAKGTPICHDLNTETRLNLTTHPLPTCTGNLLINKGTLNNTNNIE